ncbi:lysine-specific demethylase JMJ14 isoform X1 [Spatholobus suberectus]|nr:lysine-specific demethylase JMJ14 isoform X1 [Spatholobus suberectus]
MKTNLLQSTFSDDMKGINSVGTKTDTKALGAKENKLFYVSTDSTSTSTSSDSEDAQVANG